MAYTAQPVTLHGVRRFLELKATQIMQGNGVPFHMDAPLFRNLQDPTLTFMAPVHFATGHSKDKEVAVHVGRRHWPRDVAAEQPVRLTITPRRFQVGLFNHYDAETDEVSSGVRGYYVPEGQFMYQFSLPPTDEEVTRIHRGMSQLQHLRGCPACGRTFSGPPSCRTCPGCVLTSEAAPGEGEDEDEGDEAGASDRCAVCQRGFMAGPVRCAHCSCRLHTGCHDSLLRGGSSRCPQCRRAWKRAAPSGGDDASDME